MQLIDQLNLNTLRVFECVYRHKNMTLAARELHLTQSGVSQHIKSLEDFLGIKLFDRVKQKLMPTSAAANLFEKCQRGFSQLEQTILEITGKQGEISGIVSIGLPPEFGYNVTLPLLAKFSEAYPKVTLNIEVGIAATINEQVIRGEVDFAFVDSLAIDKRITMEPVFNEYILMCATPQYLKKKKKLKVLNQKNYYESLEYLAYVKDETFTRSWFQHHLGKKKLSLKIKSYVMDCHSVGKLILGHMGAGVLPSHLADRLKEDGHKITVFPGRGKPLKNIINLAYLPDRSPTIAATCLMEWLKKEYKILSKKLNP